MRSTNAGTISVALPWIASSNLDTPSDGSRFSSAVWARGACLRALRALRSPDGRPIEGAVVGKALYAGAFTLPEALDVAGRPADEAAAHAGDEVAGHVGDEVAE